MPRLVFEEPPQHGIARSPVDNAALRTRRAAERKQKRSASPKTPAVGDAKRRKCPSPRSQAVIAVKHEAARALPPKARKRMMKQIAEEEGVGQQYARQVAARLVQKRELSTRKGVGGKPRRIKEEDAEKLLSTLEEHAYELTFKQLEEITNIPASTIWRWSKRENFRQVNKGTRPCLSEANMTSRLAWAEEHEDEEWEDTIDLDEKWLYAMTYRVKLKLPPGVTKPKIRIKSKRYIPKVMMLTAITKPDPAHNFNGLIGCWRVRKKRTHPDGTPWPAQRGDKRTGLKKGDDIWQDCTMDGKLFETFLIEKVIPSVRVKMPWKRVVHLQFDNAPGHLTQGKKDEPTSAIGSRIASHMKARRGLEIKLRRQEANSPCTNLNDLGFYASWDSRIPHLRPFDVDELAAMCEAAFWEYPSEKLEALVETKKAVCKSIIAAGGNNDFKLPHKKAASE